MACLPLIFLKYAPIMHDRNLIQEVSSWHSNHSKEDMEALFEQVSEDITRKIHNPYKQSEFRKEKIKVIEAADRGELGTVHIVQLRRIGEKFGVPWRLNPSFI
jgi:hypothetical protein